MKKTVSLVLVLIIALGMLSAGALADGGAIISVASKSDASVGDTIVLPVSISGNTGFGALTLRFAYDKEKLELAGIDAGELAEGALFEPAAGSWTEAEDEVGMISAESISGNGTLFTLTFKVIAAGESSVSLTLTSFGDINGNTLEAGLVAGTVTAAAAPAGYIVTVDNRSGSDTPAAVTGIVSGEKYDGETTFTVDCGKACVVMYSTDGETFVRVPCTTDSEGGHSFTLSVTADTTVVVAIKGDITGDGKINNLDYTQSLASVRGKLPTPVSEIQKLVADVDANATVNNIDCTQILAASRGKLDFIW